MQTRNPAHRIPLDFLRANARVTETELPTAMAIMALSGEQHPTFYEILTAQDFRAELDRLGLRARSVCNPESLRRVALLPPCVGKVPERDSGPLMTTIATSDADIFVAAVNESNVGTVVS